MIGIILHYFLNGLGIFAAIVAALLVWSWVCDGFCEMTSWDAQHHDSDRKEKDES